MIVEILAVVDGSLLDFVDGLLLLVAQFAAIRTLQMGPSVTQIRESVKICGMLSRRLRLRRSKDDRRNDEQKRGNSEHQLAKDFHRTYGSYSSEMNLQDPSG